MNNKKPSKSKNIYVDTPIHTSPNKNISVDLRIIRRLAFPLMCGFVIGIFGYLAGGALVRYFSGQSTKQVNESAVQVQKTFIDNHLREDVIKSAEVISQMYFDPYTLLTEIKENKNTVTLLDVRPDSEYRNGHIMGAISVPFSGQSDLLNKTLKYKNKRIIIYGGSAYSTDPLKAFTILLKNNFDARMLAVGWNEWKHLSTVWLPESQWTAIDINNFIKKD